MLSNEWLSTIDHQCVVKVAWWHGAVPICSALSGSCQYARGHEHGSLRSSCLAGPVVTFGHQAAWWPGAHWWLGLRGFRSPVDWRSSRMAGGSLVPRGCPGSSRWRAPGLLRLCLRVRRPRTTHQDKQSRPCKTHYSFLVGQDTHVLTLCCGSHPLGPTVD